MTYICAPRFAEEIRPDLEKDVRREMLSAYRVIYPDAMYRNDNKGAYLFDPKHSDSVRDFLKSEVEAERAKALAPRNTAKFASMNAMRAYKEEHRGTPVFELSVGGSDVKLFTNQDVHDMLSEALAENDRLNTSLEETEEALRKKNSSYASIYSRLKTMTARYETARRWLDIYEKAAAEMRAAGVKPKLRIPSGGVMGLVSKKKKSTRGKGAAA